MLWTIKAFLYPRFRRLFPFGLFLRQENASFVSMINPVLRNGQRILDAGCGDGNITEVLLSLPYKLSIVALDESPAMMAAVPDDPCLEKKIAPLDCSGLPGGSFDLITCVGVMEYIRDPLPALVEFKRLIKPGGTMFITFAHPVFFNYLRFGYGQRLFMRNREASINLLQSAGWNVLSNRHTSMQYQCMVQLSD